MTFLRYVICLPLCLALFPGNGFSVNQDSDPATEILEESFPSGKPKSKRNVIRDSEGVPWNHGLFQSWHENGQVHESGNYKDGKKVGRWDTYHPDGSVAASGIYRRGLRIQRWNYHDETGKRLGESGKYRPEFEDYPSGAQRSAGENRGKLRHGHWTWWYENGRVALEGTYRIGKKIDKWTWYHQDGSLRYEGTYVKGKREGDWSYYHSGGLRDSDFLSGSYKRDQRLGSTGAQQDDPSGVDFSTLPSPNLPGIVTSETEERLRGIVRMSLNTTDPKYPKQLKEWEHIAVPFLLQHMIELDLEREEDRLIGHRLNSELLSSAIGGHDLGWMDGGDADAIASNRLTILRWHSLWELTRENDDFWEAVRSSEPMSGAAFLAWLPAVVEIGTFAATTAQPLSTPPPPPIVTSAKRAEFGGDGTERALRPALEWLIAHQHKDGFWSANGFGSECDLEGPPCDGKGNQVHDLGVTGLALMALVGGGNTYSNSAQPGGSEAVRLAAEWVRAQFDPRKGIFGKTTGHDYIYDHAISLAALCEASRGRNDPLVRKVITAAVGTTECLRNIDGGWRYDQSSDQQSDTSVTTWMTAALFTAKREGYTVSKGALTDMLLWIDHASDLETGRIGYNSTGSHSSRTVVNKDYGRESGEAMTAAGLWCRFIAGQTAKTNVLIKKHQALLMARLPAYEPRKLANDMYYCYFGTYAMFQIGGKDWEEWNKAMRATLLESQSTNGHARGSWDPIGPWAYVGGRVYSTALAALCLEVYYRFPQGNLLE